MKNDMNMNTIKTWALLIAGLLLTAACANDDAVQQKDTNTDNGTDKNLTTFVTGAEPTSRTSMDYTTGNFYWESGDYIYVQDDDGAWQKSSNAPTAKTDHFKFMVPGKFKNNTSYKVYYPGRNGSNDQVTIPAAQIQTAPNTTTHIGVSGDCGTADATGTKGGGPFNFALDHQAAILVFQPYTSNKVLKDCYLTKVEVTSDNDIAATYTLNPTNGLTGTGTGKQIILTTKGYYGSTYEKGFPLNTTSASVTTNGAYMVIKPGTHTLKVRYWVKDLVTQVEGTITKNLSSFNYAKNTYYDMAADLNVRDYDGDKYCMWDAQYQYWKGHEWNKPGYIAGVDQPMVGQSGSAYPHNNSDPRWYNPVPWPSPATHSCASVPNANELSWYVVYGDPRWDGDEVWTTMDHLYKGGMWFRKKSALIADGHYSTEKSADGSTDMRTTNKGYSNNNSSINNSGLPSAADASKYFYLPALGYYTSGWLSIVGVHGYYWSSNALPGDNIRAYILRLQSGFVSVYGDDRDNGNRAQPFSDFGDN